MNKAASHGSPLLGTFLGLDMNFAPSILETYTISAESDQDLWLVDIVQNSTLSATCIVYKYWANHKTLLISKEYILLYTKNFSFAQWEKNSQQNSISYGNQQGETETLRNLHLKSHIINYVNIDLLQYRPKYSHFYCKMSGRDEGPGVGRGGGGGGYSLMIALIC